MLRIVPLTLAQANKLVGSLHRHHKPVVGHRFSIGCADGERLIGAAIVGRPVARALDQYSIAEITRLVTDGTKHACSKLYAAAARICKEMGFEKIQTYILVSEPGTSLIASGWTYEVDTAGGDWNHSWRKGRRTDQPMCGKQRWAKILNPASSGPLLIPGNSPDSGFPTTTTELDIGKMNTETPSGRIN